jgi:hypothetical protein
MQLRPPHTGRFFISGGSFSGGRDPPGLDLSRKNLWTEGPNDTKRRHAMTEETRDEKPTKTLLDEMLERHGFKKIEPPKDFVRVFFPGVRWNVAGRTNAEDEKPGTLAEEDPS